MLPRRKRFFFSARLWLLVVGGILVGGRLAQGVELTEEALDALLFEEENVPNWQSDWLVEGRSGWRENLLLSPFNREDAAFVQGTVESTVFRPARLPGDKEWIFFGSGLYRWFPEAAKVDHEAEVIGMAQVKIPQGEKLKWGAQAIYFYIDQVFDASFDSTFTASLPMQVHHLEARPFVEWRPSEPWLVKGELVGSREFFSEPDSDYTDVSPRATAQWTTDWGRWEVLLAGAWRHFDTREANTLTGGRAAGTPLEYLDGWLRLRWSRDWLANDALSTALSTQFYRRTDTHLGYADYDRWDVGTELRWAVAGPWTVELAGTAQHYRYLSQTGFTTPGEDRDRWALTAALTVECQLSSQWTLLASHRWEETSSTQPEEEFISRQSWLGLRWSWPGW